MEKANARLAEIREEHGPAIANRAVNIANNAKRQGTDVEELRRLAGIDTDPYGAIAFRLAADLRELVLAK